MPPCALHTGSFRLGSPRSPCHPLGSPRSSPLHTHTPPCVEVPPLGSPLASSFSCSKAPPALLPWAPDPSVPRGPLLLLIRREHCPDLGTGSPARLWGLSGLESPGRPVLGLRPCGLPRPVHPDGPGADLMNPAARCGGLETPQSWLPGWRHIAQGPCGS